jgi:protein involved in polysaccharide export with SLBB domain
VPVASRITSLAALITLGLACGCASEPARPRIPSASAPATPSVRYSDVRPDDLIPSGEYRVQPGDVLEVTFTDLVGPGVETAKVVRVSESGTISLPLIGQMHVEGMTEAEVSQAIDAGYYKMNI